jgi:hypothetical protein
MLEAFGGQRVIGAGRSVQSEIELLSRIFVLVGPLPTTRCRGSRISQNQRGPSEACTFMRGVNPNITTINIAVARQVRDSNG